MAVLTTRGHCHHNVNQSIKTMSFTIYCVCWTNLPPFCFILHTVYRTLTKYRWRNQNGVGSGNHSYALNIAVRDFAFS